MNTDEQPTNSNGAMWFVAKKRKDTWRTPPGVYEPIDRFHGIDLDPCAGHGAEQLELPDGASPDPELEPTEIGGINIRPPDDGLSKSWNGVVFVNPPFSEKGLWLEKAVKESQKPWVETVYVLTPDSTDVKKWWHKHIAAEASATWFPFGRVNYIDPQTAEQSGGVSFGSAISVFGTAPPKLLDY